MADEHKEFTLTGSDGNKYIVAATNEEAAKQDLENHLGGKLSSLDKTASSALGTTLQGMGVLGQGIPKAGAALQAGLQPAIGIGSEGETFKDRYNSNLDRIQNNTAEFQKNNPKTSTGLKLAGGVATALPVVKGVNMALGPGASIPMQMAAQGGAGGTMAVADRVAQRYAEGSEDKLGNYELLKAFGHGAIPSALMPGTTKALSPTNILPTTGKDILSASGQAAAKIPRPGPYAEHEITDAAIKAVRDLPTKLEKSNPHWSKDLLTVLATGAGALHGGLPEAAAGYVLAPLVHNTGAAARSFIGSNTIRARNPTAEDILKALAQSGGIESNRQFNPEPR